MTSRLWQDAMEMRAGLRFMKRMLPDAPWLTYDYERNLDQLRKSRRERRWFLATLKANKLFQSMRLHERQRKTTP